MTNRDRLIELIYCACRNYDEYEDSFHENGMSPMESFDEFAADCLIKNGVTVNEWISVEERLPEPNKLVLCIWLKSDGDSRYGFATYQRDDIWYVSNEGMPCVTHWMPLPKPPKEVE